MLKAEPKDDHPHTANLHPYVWAGSDYGEVLLPVRPHLIALGAPVAYAQRGTEVIEHDARVRKSVGKVYELAELCVVNPRVEDETMPFEVCEPAPQRWVEEQVGWPPLLFFERADNTVVSRCAVPHTAQPSFTSGSVRFQHFSNAVTQSQIDVSNDACANMTTTRGCRNWRAGNFYESFDFSYRSQRHWPRGPPSGLIRLDVDRGDDLMATSDILAKLVECVMRVVRYGTEEMVMCIDDGK